MLSNLDLLIGLVFTKWFITYSILIALGVLLVVSHSSYCPVNLRFDQESARCFQICIVLKLVSEPYATIKQSEDEKYFVDPNQGNARFKFPSILSEPSITLSVVVPSYNEEKRRKILIVCRLPRGLVLIARIDFSASYA